MASTCGAFVKMRNVLCRSLDCFYLSNAKDNLPVACTTSPGSKLGYFGFLFRSLQRLSDGQSNPKPSGVQHFSNTIRVITGFYDRQGPLRIRESWFPTLRQMAAKSNGSASVFEWVQNWRGPSHLLDSEMWWAGTSAISTPSQTQTSLPPPWFIHSSSPCPKTLMPLLLWECQPLNLMAQRDSIYWLWSIASTPWCQIPEQIWYQIPDLWYQSRWYAYTIDFMMELLWCIWNQCMWNQTVLGTIEDRANEWWKIMPSDPTITNFNAYTWNQTFSTNEYLACGLVLYVFLSI